MFEAIKNKKTRVPYAVIYLFLLFKAGFFFNENGSMISSLLLLILLFVLMAKSKKSVNSKAMMLVMVMTVLQFMTFFVTGLPSFPALGLLLVNHLTAILIVSAFSYKQFVSIYSDIVLLSCIASLICLAAQFVGVPFYTLFPVLTNSVGVTTHFLLLTNVWASFNTDFGFNRMMGIFWEPGAFQAMITFAAIIDMYSEKKRRELNIRLLIYAVSIVFAYSTTGYLSLLLISALYFKRFSKYGTLAVSFFACVAFFIISILMTSTSGYLYYSLFGKLENVNEVLAGADATGTETTRVESVIYPLKMFLNSPIFGIGIAGHEQMAKQLGHSMFTCTPVNIFANYGIFYGVIFLLGIIRLLALNKKPLMESVLLASLVLVTTFSETLDYNPILESFMLFGYLIYKKDELRYERFAV